MNKYRIIVTNIAKNDIKEITSYIAQTNLKAALGVLGLFKKVFEMLSFYPLIGNNREALKDKNILVYTIKKKYSIVYKIIEDKIVIYRILTKYQNLFAIL